MLDMHSLVHLALKFRPRQSHIMSMTREDAIDHLSRVFPSDEWDNRTVWRQYFPHVLPLVKGGESEASMSSSRLGYWVGQCLYVDGRRREATEVLQFVVTIRKKLMMCLTLPTNLPWGMKRRLSGRKRERERYD